MICPEVYLFKMCLETVLKKTLKVSDSSVDCFTCTDVLLMYSSQVFLHSPVLRAGEEVE